MATDPQTLMDSAACYECGGDQGMFQLYALALLKQILLAQDPNAMTDPNTLMEQAKCYACTPPGFWPLFQLALLQQISVNGGGGGGGGAQLLLYTTTDPTTDGIVPTNQNQPAMAYKADGTGATYVWDPVNHVWS